MKSKTAQRKQIQVKESFFAKSIRLLRSYTNKTGLMILFDALFLISVFALNRIAQYIVPFIAGASGPNLASTALFVIFSLIYYLVAIFAYSFFKCSVLDSVKSLFEQTAFSFKNFWGFYALNIVIAGIFFAIIIFANFLLASIQKAYAPYVFIVLAIPFLLFLYVITNLSHSAFYQGSNIAASLKFGFKMAFTKMRTYRETISIMIFLALALWLLFFGSGYLIRLISSKNYSMYLNLYSYFSQASIIAFDIVLYLVILINRVSFYGITKENR